MHAWTADWDTLGGFYPGDGAGTPMSFTAPLTGKYYINIHLSAAGTSWAFYCNTPTRQYVFSNTSPTGIAGAIDCPLTLNLNAGDVITYSAGNQTGYNGVLVGIYYSWIEGWLLESSTSSSGQYSFSANTSPGLVTYSNQSYLGSAEALNTIFSYGGGWYPGDGVGAPAMYTIQKAGRYQLNLMLNGITGGGRMYMVTTTALGTFDCAQIYSPDVNDKKFHCLIVVDCALGDTFKILTEGGDFRDPIAARAPQNWSMCLL
jgi:hypothetical protein